jgi:hypothetical protein
MRGATAACRPRRFRCKEHASNAIAVTAPRAGSIRSTMPSVPPGTGQGCVRCGQRFPARRGRRSPAFARSRERPPATGMVPRAIGAWLRQGRRSLPPRSGSKRLFVARVKKYSGGGCRSRTSFAAGFRKSDTGRRRGSSNLFATTRDAVWKVASSAQRPIL